jgi:hypothetical protein
VPSAPAADTAPASEALVTRAIGADISGASSPKSSVNRVRITVGASYAAGAAAGSPLDPAKPESGRRQVR